MLKTEKTVILLKTIATIAGLAVILWSLGLPSLRFADAANITDVRDTLSDSAPSAASNHTIHFVTPTGVLNNGHIIVDFPAGFTLTGIGEEDIDLNVNGANVTNANWSISSATTTGTIDLTITTGSIAAGATTTLTVGLNATAEGSPNSQITNPSGEGSYEIGFTVGASDSGWTRVVILDDVLVTASVDTIFTFAVAGLGAGVSVNGTTTTGTTGSTSIPFGNLQAGVATRTAQMLTVNTNASNGYVVTVQLDQPLQSSTGADIDGFAQGSYTNTPIAWAAPTNIVGSENTYGHWGITSDDDTTTRDAGDEFNANEWASPSTTAATVVMSHTGPANGTGMGQGTTTVGYKVQIGGLQEAGDDYTTTLTYVATPTF
jgi:hypothetical protein